MTDEPQHDVRDIAMGLLLGVDPAELVAAREPTEQTPEEAEAERSERYWANFERQLVDFYAATYEPEPPPPPRGTGGQGARREDPGLPSNSLLEAWLELERTPDTPRSQLDRWK